MIVRSTRVVYVVATTTGKYTTDREIEGHRYGRSKFEICITIYSITGIVQMRMSFARSTCLGGWNSTRFCVCLQHSFYTSLGQGHRHHKRHVKITRRIFCATVIANFFRATQLKIDRERWTSSSLFFIWTYKAINGSLKRWIHRREKKRILPFEMHRHDSKPHAVNGSLISTNSNRNCMFLSLCADKAHHLTHNGQPPELENTIFMCCALV